MNKTLMKTTMLVSTIAAVITLIVCGLTVQSHGLTITSYTSSDLWKSEVGEYKLIDFTNNDLEGISLNTLTGYIADDRFNDRVADGKVTEWSFSDGFGIYGFGATWNLLPEMIGTGLKFTFFGRNDTTFTIEPTLYYGFLGFVSDTPLSMVRIGEGSDLGRSETYLMDNLVYSTANEPVPEPATMLLFGIGVLALTGARRFIK